MPQTEFFVILNRFCLTIDPENQNFEKMKKKKNSPGDIILHMCNITGCTVPEIWSTTDRIFFILDSFLPFYPTNPKNQNFQKMRKTTQDIIILHKSTKNQAHMPHYS